MKDVIILYVYVILIFVMVVEKLEIQKDLMTSLLKLFDEFRAAGIECLHSYLYIRPSGSDADVVAAYDLISDPGKSVQKLYRLVSALEIASDYYVFSHDVLLSLRV